VLLEAFAQAVEPCRFGHFGERFSQLLFRVEDLAWSTQQVVDAGGRVEFGPLDVPSAGVTTSVRDPHGALYVLMQPHPRTAA